MKTLIVSNAHCKSTFIPTNQKVLIQKTIGLSLGEQILVSHNIYT